MSKKGEGRDNSPSKHTCSYLSVLARLRWEWVVKLSLWAEFSPFPSWHRKCVIEKILDLVKEKLAKNMTEIKSYIQNKHALSIDVGKVVV
jgi:hypothetical protein